MITIRSIEEGHLVWIPYKGECRSRIWSMSDWRTNLEQILLTTNDTPLVSGMITKHSIICKIGLKWRVTQLIGMNNTAHWDE